MMRQGLAALAALAGPLVFFQVACDAEPALERATPAKDGT